MSEFIEMCDTDASGPITKDKFVDGIFHLEPWDCAFEMLQALKVHSEMRRMQNFVLEYNKVL